MNRYALILLPLTLSLTLAACGGGNPLRVKRSPCPAVGVLGNAGSVTLFNPTESRDANAIDVVASITNLRPLCNDNGRQVVTNARFDVIAQRRDTAGTRTITLPWMAVVVRAGDQLQSKQVGWVSLTFEDGQARTQASASLTSSIDSNATQLPTEVQLRINRKRKAGDADAALDPMAAPEVKAALKEANFELLVGFQLDEAGLAYNITR